VYYYVVVTNTNNGATGAKTASVTSDAAKVVVNAPVDAATPVISAQPQSATYTKDDAATALSVSASVTDGGTLSYQWYSNSAATTSGGAVITNATKSTYTPPTTITGTVYYYVMVTNTNNSAKTASTTSATAKITVNAANGEVSLTVGFETDKGALTFSGDIGTLGAADTKTINLDSTGDWDSSKTEWYIDGDLNKTGGSSFTIDASSLLAGGHSFTVVVYIDSVPYSKRIPFTVGD
jgi:hypothetical protein